MENSRGSSRSGVVCRTSLFFRLGGSGRVFLGDDLGGTWSTKNPRNTTSIRYVGYKEKQNRGMIRILTETEPRRKTTTSQRGSNNGTEEDEEGKRRNTEEGGSYLMYNYSSITNAMYGVRGYPIEHVLWHQISY